MNYNKKLGFTLIELIVVIAILAILAVALLPLITSFIEKSRVSQVLSSVASLETAGAAFQADNASLPIDIGEVGMVLVRDSEVVTNANNRATWDGPYLSNQEGVTPWGGKFFLSTSPDPNDFSRLLWGLLILDEAAASGIDPTAGAAMTPLAKQKIDEKMDGTVNFEEGKEKGKVREQFGAFGITILSSELNGEAPFTSPVVD